MTHIKNMPHSVGAYLKGVGVESVELDANNHLIVHLDNGQTVDAGEFKVDDKLDAESTRPLANKTLSSLFSAVNERINTLVGGNATEAIDNLNEIIAFLQNFKDSETLASTLAEINNAIAEVENDLQIKWTNKGYQYETLLFTETGEYDVPSGINYMPGLSYIVQDDRLYKLEGKISLSGGVYVEKINNKLVISGQNSFTPIHYVTVAKPILDILLPNTVLRKDDVLGDIIADSTLPVQSDAIAKELQKKVDKVEGKGLSTNDYDNEEKAQVERVRSGSVVVDNTDDSITPEGSKPVSGSAVYNELHGLKRNIKDVYTTTEGREYSHKIDLHIPAGASVCISISSNGGIFKDDLIGSVSVQYTNSIVVVASSFNYLSSDIRFVAEDDISYIKLSRSMTGVIASGDVTVIVSYESSSIMGEIELLKRDVNKISALYISPSGDDAASGTFAEPKKTVNACLDAGATKVLCMGGVYKQSIDASKIKNMTLELVKLSTNERVIFERPNSIIGESAKGVSGYSKVLQMSAPSTFFSSSLWLYQAGIADSETLINEVERYPMQRGLTHRCDATLIEHCTSTTLSDALAEIESSDKYLWFYDSVNRLIYLSCPTSVSTSNPIKEGAGSLFYNDTTGIAFKAVGIDVRYQNINLSGMRNAELIDCSSMYCGGVGGAFTWDNGIVKLTRCEAARCIAMASTGDGFNAHASKTGDATSKTCIAELIDCWAHDNNDDGFSDHERAESVLRGGLFEYNKKGGVTPAYGSHCSCYGVISRKNYSGFLCIGEAAIDEGGNGTQLLCVDCVSLDNDRGYPNVGFNVDGAGNKITLIRCMAIGCDTAFNVAESASMYVYDCGTMNCTNVFNNKGTVRVHATSLVASL